MAERDRARAYRYAWWLTGDAERAAAAVTEAVERVDTADTPAEDLLREVREASVETPTMGARAELALLHDACDLPLGQAARIVGVSADDAPAVLAQGRLDALDERVTVVHAERLGGLAVASPGALAHTETCPSCAQLARKLLEGRDALVALGAVAPEPTAGPRPAGPVAEEDAGADHAGGPDGGADTEAAAQPGSDDTAVTAGERGNGSAAAEAAAEHDAAAEAAAEDTPEHDAAVEAAGERAARAPIRIDVDDDGFAVDDAGAPDDAEEEGSRPRLLTGALLAALALAIVLAVAVGVVLVIALTSVEVRAAGLA